MHIKVREFITNGATKVSVISVHVKLYLCVAGRWWVKMPGPFFNPSQSLIRALIQSDYFPALSPGKKNLAEAFRILRESLRC